ncbi:MAG: hypothetical protein ACT4N9_01415 [Paracoccaceae bacterium]
MGLLVAGFGLGRPAGQDAEALPGRRRLEDDAAFIGSIRELMGNPDQFAE